MKIKTRIGMCVVFFLCRELQAQYRVTPSSRQPFEKRSTVGKYTEDALLMSLGNPATRDAAIETYRTRGRKAVPALVEHLQNRQKSVRILAMSALQHAWSEEAVAAVSAFLYSVDDSERRVAWAVLNRHLNQEDLDVLLAPILHRLDPKLVASVFPRLERNGPDMARIARMASRPQYVESILPALPRYQGKTMIPLTRKLAGSASGGWRALALAGLIQQGDTEAVTVMTMRSWLQHADPRVREYVAEYFRWHGRASDVKVLRDRLEREQDAYVRSGLVEALRIISHRSDRTDSVFPQRADFEPVYRYDGQKFEGLQAAQNRLEQLRAYAGYPVRTNQDHPVEPVQDFMAPTRGYWRTGAGSFGRFMEPDQGGAFANSVHVGDDVSWGECMATVVAIGPGVVSLVQVGNASWGGIVVVEHRNAKGDRFCSLYAHMGPLISVQQGDPVIKGQKLGALGRSYTLENGGYRSHLHFGMYKGTYDNGHWVSGYLDPKRFERGEHHWLNPRDYLPEPLKTSRATRQ